MYNLKSHYFTDIIVIIQLKHITMIFAYLNIVSGSMKKGCLQMSHGNVL